MDLCFVDTETTSLSAEFGEIWEFAGIRRTPTGIEREMEFQIEADLGTADPMSLKIGMYRERFGKNGFRDNVPEVYANGGPFPDYGWNPMGKVVPRYVAARLIENFTRGATLIGNVISFDSERMERLLRSEGECPGWHYHVIDLEPYAVGFLKGKGLANFDLPYRSSEISQALGVAEPEEGKDLHTAMGDSRWVMNMWDAIQTWPQD